MEMYYTAEFTVHNTESGAWLSRVCDGGSGTDKEIVKNVWHSESSRLSGSKDFDYVCVLWRDNFGRVYDIDVRDRRVAPEPEPNEA